MEFFRYVGLFFGLLTLAACQTTSFLGDQGVAIKLNPKEISIFSDRQNDYKAISYWNLSASFSYNDTKEIAAGKINWKFDSQESSTQKRMKLLMEKIDLLAPLGAGAATLYIDSSKGATFVSGNTQRYGEDPSSLLFDVVGWSLPIEELRYWIYGLPSPKKKGYYLLDEKGNLKSLQQSGWQIQYSDYLPFSSAQGSITSYPRKIVAENKGRHLKIKLITKQFQLN